MLEKVVLICSAYFCVATEIRFILQQDFSDVKNISKKDSEAYHAKSLHLALLFLPPECPLSQYIRQTYVKNFLQPKLKLQKQRTAYLNHKVAKNEQLLKGKRESEDVKEQTLPKRPQTAMQPQTSVIMANSSSKNHQSRLQTNVSPDMREKVTNLGKKASNAITPELLKHPSHKQKVKSGKVGTPASIAKKTKQPSISTINEIRKPRGITPSKKIFLSNVTKIQTPAERGGHNVKKIKIDLGFSLSPDASKRTLKDAPFAHIS